MSWRTRTAHIFPYPARVQIPTTHNSTTAKAKCHLLRGALFIFLFLRVFVVTLTRSLPLSTFFLARYFKECECSVIGRHINEIMLFISQNDRLNLCPVSTSTKSNIRNGEKNRKIIPFNTFSVFFSFMLNATRLSFSHDRSFFDFACVFSLVFVQRSDVCYWGKWYCVVRYMNTNRM